VGDFSPFSDGDFLVTFPDRLVLALALDPFSFFFISLIHRVVFYLDFVICLLDGMAPSVCLAALQGRWAF